MIPLLLSLPACLGAQNPAPVSAYGATPGEGSAGVHIVSGGETLYTISNRYKIEMRDIATVNNLQAPIKLVSGQRLKLPPPQQYRVRAGDTLYEISRLFNTDTSAVARQNNLQAPFKLSAGQVLRMPSSQAASQPSAPRMTSRELAQNGASRSVLMAGRNASPSFTPQQDLYNNPDHVLKAPPKPVQNPSHILRAPERMDSAPEPELRVTELPPLEENPVSRPVKISATPPAREGSKFLQPVKGRIISSFGPKADGLHNDGINIEAPRGSPVQAAENGVVVYVGNELKGSGNLILIRHDGGYFTAYAHLDKFEIQRGATVSRGQIIGRVGSTGAVSSPQLHFELRKGAQAINPNGKLSV